MRYNVRKSHPLDQSSLYAVQSRAKLAKLFGLTRKGLDAVLAMERPYSKRSKEIMRNGITKIRIIQEPRCGLRPIHKVIRKLLSRIEPPDFLFCPVKRRSYVTNAAQHVVAKEIRKLDIHAYFPSTPRHRVYWFFHTIMRCSEDVTAVLAQLLTAEGHLPTGSTVSPILSFFAFYDMWHQMARMAKEAGCILTVYIDDATISGRAVPDRLIWEIRKAIYSRGLRYHKERRYTRGIAEVTGVIIRDGKLSVPNRQRKKAHDLRQQLIAAGESAETTNLASRLNGLQNQRKQVEG